MTTNDLSPALCHSIAVALRDNRNRHINRIDRVHDVTVMGNEVWFAGNRVAWKQHLTGVHAILFGLPHRTMQILNAIAAVYGVRNPYRVDADNAFYYQNQEISTLQSQTIVGPIGMLAIEIEARAGR